MDFTHSTDILIIGGGIAGVAAALETARSGFRTTLIEKTILLGGLATTGLVNIYLPLCDGKGHQVIFGIAEELLHLSLKYGPGTVPSAWKGSSPDAKPGRYLARFSPASLVLALDEVLQEAGVDVWLDTLACRPQMDGRRITGLEVENKSGRGLITAKIMIDATGDADIVFRAGSPCVIQDNWMSLWLLQASQEKFEKALQSDDEEALLDALSLRLGASDNGTGHPDGFSKYYGVEGKQVSQFVLDGRRLLRQQYQQAYSGGANRSTLFPVTLPAMAQFRTTRRIDGLDSLLDGQNNLPRPTSVGLTGDWRKPGPVWEIPYGSLVPSGVDGVLAAGRCIDARGDAWQVMRVIPSAALTGQLSGIAAGLALSSDSMPHQLPITGLQTELQRRGIPYHLDQI